MTPTLTPVRPGLHRQVLDFSECHCHNIWNPVSELLCHTHIGTSMEALFDEEDMGRIALSCHFALDILCDKKMS